VIRSKFTVVALAEPEILLRQETYGAYKGGLYESKRSTPHSGAVPTTMPLQ